MTASVAYGPRLNPKQAKLFTGLSEHQLKSLRRNREIRFYKLTARSLVYDRDSLAAFLAARCVESLGGQ